MRILLVQTSFLGDTILSTPVIAAIHRQYPGCELWMLVTPASAEFVRHDPLLSGVLTFDKGKSERGLRGLRNKACELRAMNFRRVYALHRSARTALLLWLSAIPERIGFRRGWLSFLYTCRVRRPGGVHEVLKNMALLQQGDGDSPGANSHAALRLFPPLVSEVGLEHRIRLESQRRYIVLVPGSARVTKRWFWQGYRAVAEHFSAQGNEILLIGTEAERTLCERVAAGLPVVNLCGSTKIGEFMAYVQHARLMVCNDSVSLHLASAFKIPTVAIFCATSPEFGFGPWQNRAVVLQQEGLACKPCSIRGGKACPTATRRCMEGVSAQAVIDAALGLLRDHD